MSRIYARTILFLRVVVIAALGVAAWASVHYLPGVSTQVQLSARGLLPSHSRAERTEQESARLFGSSLLPRIAVVQRDPSGLSPADQRHIVQLAVRLDRRGLTGFPHGFRAPSRT